MRQGPAVEIGTDIFINRVRGNDDRGSVHNAAGSVSGMAGHGTFRSEGMRVFLLDPADIHQDDIFSAWSKKSNPVSLIFELTQ